MASSRSETPWRSDIDFQEMARDLVESARKKEAADDSPPTVEQVVAMLAGCLTDVAKVFEIHGERLTRIEKDLRWLCWLVMGVWFITLVFLGMVVGAILGV